MATAVKRFRVRYERGEDGWWVGTVRGVRGCHTQGRTIEETRRRIREALGLFVRNADRAELVDEILLPADVRAALAAARVARRQLERQQAEAATRLARALRILQRRLQVSVRDAGALLGISHQRVHQITGRLSARA